MKELIAVVLAALMLMRMLAACTSTENGPGKNTYNLKTVKESYLIVITSPDYAPTNSTLWMPTRTPLWQIST